MHCARLNHSTTVLWPAPPRSQPTLRLVRCITMLRLHSLLLCAQAVSACPGTGQGVLMHASAELTVDFAVSCGTVAAEIMARVAGQSDTPPHWTDPHNQGTYSCVGTCPPMAAASGVTLQRVTGGSGRYTDKMDFSFSTVGTGCQVTACSEVRARHLLSPTRLATPDFVGFCSPRSTHILTTVRTTATFATCIVARRKVVPRSPQMETTSSRST